MFNTTGMSHLKNAGYTGCPTTNQTWQFFNNFTTNEDVAQQLGTHYRHIPLHFSPTNILLFKSHCNIFIGFGFIKELLGLVGSGTPCMFQAQQNMLVQMLSTDPQ
jgi:hypothetical protein